MKQEQFIRIRVKLMEQLRQGAEWSDEEILERIDLLVSETARENRLTVKQREEIRRELFYSVRKLDIFRLWYFCIGSRKKKSIKRKNSNRCSRTILRS